MPDPRRFLIDTDHPIDLVIATYEGTLTIPSGGGEAKTPHRLPFVPLLGGLWSDDDFVHTHNFLARQDYMASEVLRREVTLRGGLTNITIASDAAGPIQYKIYAYAPPEFTGEIPNFTQVPSSANFRLNSDYNYMKTRFFGKQMFPIGSGLEYPHNLGYVPVVDVWSIYTDDNTPSGNITSVVPYDQMKTQDYDKIRVTDTLVRMYTDSFGSVDPPNGFYLRVYYDEA